MDGPGYDTESMTGLAAAGSHLMVFTTGRGNPIGYPIVPVIKVASTSSLYEKMTDDMDIDAGVILAGTSLEEVAGQIVTQIRQVLNGEPTKAERNRQDGIVCLYTLNPAF
jgi:altronate dehydratase large subunit